MGSLKNGRPGRENSRPTACDSTYWFYLYLPGGHCNAAEKPACVDLLLLGTSHCAERAVLVAAIASLISSLLHAVS